MNDTFKRLLKIAKALDSSLSFIAAPLADIDDEELLSMYNSGEYVTMKELAKHFGVSHTTIANRLRGLNVDIRKNRPLPMQLDENKIVEMYKDNKSVYDIADYFGISSQTVRKRLKQLQIESRNKNTKVDQEEIVRLFNSGMKPMQIARHMQTDVNNVYRALSTRGIRETKPRIDANQIMDMHKSGMSPEDIAQSLGINRTGVILVVYADKIVDMYQKGTSSTQIAQNFNVHQNSILQVLREKEVKRRPVGRKKTPPLEQISQMYHNQLPYEEIASFVAKKMGVSKEEAYRILNEVGVNRKRHRWVANITKEQLVDLIENQKMPYYLIAEKLKISTPTLFSLMNEFGIERIKERIKPKRTKKPIPEQQSANLRRLYLDEKLSIEQIAKMMGVNMSTISRQLKRIGVEARSGGGGDKKLTPEQIADLQRLYVDDKLSVPQIAERMSLNQATIYNYLRRLGVEKRPITKLTPEKMADLKRLYVDEKLSTYQIAKMMEVDHTTIYNYLKRLGVETRPRWRKTKPNK